MKRLFTGLLCGACLIFLTLPALAGTVRVIRTSDDGLIGVEYANETINSTLCESATNCQTSGWVSAKIPRSQAEQWEEALAPLPNRVNVAGQWVQVEATPMNPVVISETPSVEELIEGDGEALIRLGLLILRELLD